LIIDFEVMQILQNAVIIVSGGSGSRMQSEVPKQYMDVNGKAILVWTVEKFLAFDPQIFIVLVLADGHQDFWNPIKNRFFREREFIMARGGESRFDSVKSGLEMIKDDCIVGIHDAVRPMVSIETIKRCYDSAREFGSAIPVIDVEDTIRSVGAQNSNQVNRENLKRVQTPQVFAAHQIKEAYRQSYTIEFTDDATVYERKFNSVKLVEGNPENIKITKPVDLKILSILLS